MSAVYCHIYFRLLCAAYESLQMAALHNPKKARSTGPEQTAAAADDKCEWDSFLHSVFHKNGTDTLVASTVLGIAGSSAIGCSEIAGVVAQLKWSGALSAPTSTLEEYEERKNKAIDRGMIAWELNEEVARLVTGVDASPKQVRLAVTSVLDQCRCFPFISTRCIS